jgi:hypothetical protein
MASQRAKSHAPKNKGGRPRKTINWEEVARLASYHCTQQEIADWFDCNLSTLEEACQRDNECSFPEFFAQKKGQLKPRLRKIQWQIAFEGNASMAIWLGKQHLGQTDQPVDVVILEAMQKSGLTKDQVLELINTAAANVSQQAKRSFEDFVEVAGYPKPFEKQVEMMEFGIKETEPRLLLGARGYGKTDYVVILGLAYEIYLNPLASSHLIITKSKERNASMINEIQQACEKNGVVFEKANSTCLRVAGLQGKDHSVSAVTIKTVSLRGRHPTRVILDDPVTEDDTSEATRLLVEKKWNEVNKLVSNILVIGQPAHKFDLYAKLRPLLKKLEVPHGSIPELDHDLEAQRLAGVDESSIMLSYHLKIPNEGTTPFDNIRYIDKFPVGQSSVAFIDPAHEGLDYTALTIMKAHFEGVAVVGFVWKKAWNHCLDEITPMLNKYAVKKLAFETNALGDQPVMMLRELFGGGVIGRKTTTNKHARIMSAGAYAHLIHLSKESSQTYINQVVQYEYNSKNDDAPDSLASCLEWIGLIRGKR